MLGFINAYQRTRLIKSIYNLDCKESMFLFHLLDKWNENMRNTLSVMVWNNDLMDECCVASRHTLLSIKDKLVRLNLIGISSSSKQAYAKYELFFLAENFDVQNDVQKLNNDVQKLNILKEKSRVIRETTTTTGEIEKNFSENIEPKNTAKVAASVAQEKEKSCAKKEKAEAHDSDRIRSNSESIEEIKQWFRERPDDWRNCAAAAAWREGQDGIAAEEIIAYVQWNAENNGFRFMTAPTKGLPSTFTNWLKRAKQFKANIKPSQSKNYNNGTTTNRKNAGRNGHTYDRRQADEITNSVKNWVANIRRNQQSYSDMEQTPG